MGDRRTARISVAEMKSYYVYSEWCSWLASVAEGESPGPEAAVLWVPPRAPVAVTSPPGEGFYTSARQKGGHSRESPASGAPEQGAAQGMGVGGR